VALANKLARIVYALATKGGQYDDRPVHADQHQGQRDIRFLRQQAEDVTAPEALAKPQPNP
jgi:hypothetical protein